MLKVAYPYREEVNKKMCEIAFNPKYMFYNTSSYWEFDCKIKDSTWEALQFVSINRENQVIGFLSAAIDRDCNKVSNIGAINFQDLNTIFAHDIGDFLVSLFNKFNYRKIEFYVVVGNPVERSYDKMISRYGGRIVGIKKESIKLIDNKLYDEKFYEIFKSDYEKAMKSIKLL